MTTYSGTDVREFLSRAQDFLEQQEALNSLPLGLCLQLRAAPMPPLRAPLFIAVYEGNTVVAVAIQTPPHNMIFVCGSDDCGDAADAVIRVLAEKGHNIPGINSRVPASLTFAERMQAHTGRAFSPVVEMRLYTLSSVDAVPRPPGAMRMAGMTELDLLTDWMTAFQQEAAPNEPAGAMRDTIAGKIERGELVLWDDDGPVSAAARARATRSTVTVNYVYTPPHLRGRGYATACVADLSTRLLGEGFRECVLFTDLSNPTSNSIYQKIGYRPVCDFTQYRFEETSQKG